MNLPDHRYNIYTVKRSSQNQSLIPAESDSLPHAHAQTTKTYYKHQDSRIKKAQVLKTNTSANSDIKDNSSETKLRGRLLESFIDDEKYEHVGQDIRSQESTYGRKELEVEQDKPNWRYNRMESRIDDDGVFDVFNLESSEIAQVLVHDYAMTKVQFEEGKEIEPKVPRGRARRSRATTRERIPYRRRGKGQEMAISRRITTYRQHQRDLGRQPDWESEDP
nr:hypothetical protein [Tanacetum cinerariifolium]